MGTARLLPRTAVAAGAEVLGHGFMVPVVREVPVVRLKPSGTSLTLFAVGSNPHPSSVPGPGKQQRHRRGSEAGSHWAPARTTMHRSNCPHLSWLWTCFQQPSKYSSCNPNPFNPPQNQQPLQEDLAKGKNLPVAPVGGSHKAEPAVPQHPWAMPKSHLGHQPGNTERVRVVGDPSAALW